MEAKEFMKCYFDYCVYQKNNVCILSIDGIEINNLGMCEHCEIVTIDAELLTALKQKRPNDITKIWNDKGE